MVWMTDGTPHEALPQTQDGVRQFFRLVMPYVSHCYADHSTPNPKVRLPKTITVIHGNKFGEDKKPSAAAATAGAHQLAPVQKQIAVVMMTPNSRRKRYMPDSLGVVAASKS